MISSTLRAGGGEADKRKETPRQITSGDTILELRREKYFLTRGEL